MFDSGVWDKTFLRTQVAGLPALRVHSAVIEMASGNRLLHASLTVAVNGAGPGAIQSTIDIPLDSTGMRALIAALDEHATRLDGELLAVAHSGDMPAGLYREPEAA
jgi:hypothetical protein